MRGIKFMFLWTCIYVSGIYAQTIVNQYAKVISFPSCTPCFSVCDQVMVDNASSFAVGDEVLLIQMKGANAVWSQDSTFGTITSYGSAGFHEVLTIASITGTQIRFTTAISGNYDPAMAVQLVRIFKQVNYTVPALGVTAQDWNGNTGGVIYMNISGTLTLSGDISASGKGFRGALNPNSNTKTYGCGTDSLGTLNKGQYFLNLSEIEFAGRKGEGVVAFRNPQYELGKGPLGNGGGGGINHNAGGGGGGNMGAGGKGGNMYEGYTTCTYTGNGMGGKVMDRMGGLRLFLGGGGGGGHENNNNGTSGGHGGGVIIIQAGTIQGNGFKIISDGMIGYNRNGIDGGPGGDDGAGGGGAGGAIKLDIANYGASPLLIQARGGDGGSIDHSGKHGSGGGGGGGLICLTANALPGTVTTNSQGGLAGKQIQSLTPNDYYFALAGGNGITALGCSSVSVEPPKLVPFSLGGDLQLCVPPLATLQTGLASPYTFKWYKNGGLLSAETGPTLTVNASGTYVAEVGTPLCDPMKDTLIVTQKGNITPVDASFCNSSGAQSVTLSIANADPLGKYVWYDHVTGGVVKGSGTSIVIPNLLNDTVLYVEDTTKIITTIGPVDVANAPNSYYSSHGIENESGRVFNVIAPLKIMSVEIKGHEHQGGCGASGSSKSIKVLLLQNGVAIDSTPLTPIVCMAFTKVPLNFTIPPGSGYELKVKGIGAGHYGLSSEKQAYKITDVIDIMPNYDYSGAFFKWNIAYGSLCGRLPVRAKNACPASLVFTRVTVAPSYQSKLLQWSVTQRNCSKFIIEKSLDGLHFETIGTVVCQNSLNYTYTDVSDQPGYYRIKMIDQKKEIHLSQTVAALQSLSNEFTVYPNPSQGMIRIQTSREIAYQVQIFNVLGQMLHTQDVDGEGNSNPLIDMSAYLKSEQVLVLRIYSPEEGVLHTERLVVKP